MPRNTLFGGGGIGDHSFAKMRLVDEEELQHQKERRIADYNPHYRIMAVLDDEMKQMLYCKELDVQQKLNLFNAALHRFRNMLGGPAPIKPTTTPQTVSTGIQPTPNDEISGDLEDAEMADTKGNASVSATSALAETKPEFKTPVKAERMRTEGLMDNVKPEFVKNAVSILESMRIGSPHLSIEPETQAFTVDGVTVPNTNINHILRWLGNSHPTASKPPNGAKRFLSAMRMAGVNPELVANAEARGVYEGMGGGGTSPIARHARRSSRLAAGALGQTPQKAAGRRHGRSKGEVMMMAPRPSTSSKHRKKNNKLSRIKFKRGKRSLLYLY